jgi:hypothetical protein
MLFGPVPGTRLYQDYEAEDKLLKNVPWPEQHGQDRIWFTHPEFTDDEVPKVIKESFQKKYHSNGPSVLNMAHTAVKGYLRLKKDIEERQRAGLVWDPDERRYVEHPNPQPDEYMKLRLEALRKNAIRYRPILSSTLKYAPNEKSAEKSRRVIELFDEVFGRFTIGDRIKEKMVQACAVVENLRLKRGNGVLNRQPKVYRTTYPDRTNGFHRRAELDDQLSDSRPLPVVDSEARPEAEMPVMKELDRETLVATGKR